MRRFSSLLLVAVAALAAGPARAQSPPPIHGVTGTTATEATIKEEKKAANKIAVETKDGVEHVYDAVTGLRVHGGDQVLADLKPGTTVVIHYSPDNNTVQEIDRVGGDEGLRTTEGMATKIDRKKKEITIRYDDGKVEKLKLTDRAAADVGKNISSDTRIIVYYSADAGAKVTHYFKSVETR
jgi:ribosomal protein L2